LTQEPTQTDVPAGYERHELSVPAIVRFGIGLALMLIFVHGLLFGVYRYLQARRMEPVPRSSVDVRPLVAEPLLQASSSAERREMEAAEERFLSGYGWVDPKAGVVRIPIERAMDVLAEHGLPVRQQSTQPSAATRPESTQQ